MYSKIKNYTTMFTKYTLPLGPICTKSVSLFEWYVCDIYIVVLIYIFCFPRPRKVFNTKSRVPLLFYFHVSCKDGCDFSLHESPRYVGTDQGAFLSTGTVHFTRGPLLLYALPRAWEAELVGGHGWALNKVCVLQTLVTQGAAQGYAARHRGVRNALGVHWVHAWHVGGTCARRVPLGQPPLVHGGWREGAAAVPARGGVDLVGILGGAVSTCIVCSQDEGSHGGLAILCRLRWGGAGVGRYCGGGRGEAWRVNRWHFQSVARRWQPLLSFPI